MESVRLGPVAKRINAEDIVALLKEVYPDGIRQRNEAEALIAFDREYTDPAPAWRAFVAEAIADHLLQRCEPTGIITGEKADWLLSAIAPEGRIATAGALETLVRVIEMASEAPMSLSVFALNELRDEIIAGEGPALKGRAHFTRTVDATDVGLIRRILDAGAGVSGHPISREEAEALFDLHDAVAAGDNDPAFGDLFFRAIANHLFGASGCDVPLRREALSREPRRDKGADIAAEHRAWLALRIMRDGRPTPAELALLALVANGMEPDPSLRGLHDRAA